MVRSPSRLPPKGFVELEDVGELRLEA